MAKRNNDFFNQKKPWSIIKDKLLGYYLKPYFQKILLTKHPVTYVDCFAGAGKFNDGTDGSPLIALKVISDVLAQSKIVNTEIKSCFIEAHHYGQLNKNLECYSNTQVVSGKFEKNIGKILRNNLHRNIFLYIDPYGVKELDFEFIGSLAKESFYSMELLLNFNSVGFLRVAFKAFGIDFKNENDLLEEYDDSLPEPSACTITANKIAGGDYWKDIISEYHDGKLSFYGVEERFVAEYCRRLQKHYQYVLNMKIKSGSAIKYRMIHATNHPDGAILMADNIFKREELLREIHSVKQLSLFENESTPDMRKILSNYLPQFKTFERLNAFLAKFFCTYGVICSSQDIKSTLKIFETEGKIIVERNPATTKAGKPTKFWDDKKVKIKWNT